MKTFRINPKGQDVWVPLRADNKHSKHPGIDLDGGRGGITENYFQS